MLPEALTPTPCGSSRARRLNLARFSHALACWTACKQRSDRKGPATRAFSGGVCRDRTGDLRLAKRGGRLGRPARFFAWLSQYSERCSSASGNANARRFQGIPAGLGTRIVLVPIERDRATRNQRPESTQEGRPRPPFHINSSERGAGFIQEVGRAHSARPADTSPGPPEVHSPPVLSASAPAHESQRRSGRLHGAAPAPGSTRVFLSKKLAHKPRRATTRRSRSARSAPSANSAPKARQAGPSTRLAFKGEGVASSGSGSWLRGMIGMRRGGILLPVLRIRVGRGRIGVGARRCAVDGSAVAAWTSRLRGAGIVRWRCPAWYVSRLWVGCARRLLRRLIVCQRVRCRRRRCGGGLRAGGTAVRWVGHDRRGFGGGRWIGNRRSPAGAALGWCLGVDLRRRSIPGCRLRGRARAVAAKLAVCRPDSLAAAEARRAGRPATNDESPAVRRRCDDDFASPELSPAVNRIGSAGGGCTRLWHRTRNHRRHLGEGQRCSIDARFRASDCRRQGGHGGDRGRLRYRRGDEPVGVPVTTGEAK